ncbi:serine/threonine protein kinase, partial [Streptomyces sp. PA03-6a]|nr:serine/threonine protein kinase [Streptomyces sp. PA03-6a]
RTALPERRVAHRRVRQRRAEGEDVGGRGDRRPVGADRRLLRQRLIVFVTVTLLVALGIAAAQGCQGPSRGIGLLPGAGADVTAPHAP